MYVEVLCLKLGVVLLLCYLFYLGQIAIHNCVHCTLFRSRFLNKLVGNILSSMQLMHFEGWKVAHMQHHKYANSELDPHRVDRPLFSYIFSHYFRIARAVWEPGRFFAAIAPPLLVAGGIIVWQASLGYLARGVAWVLLYWLAPLVVSHVLVAHFNYITHAGLPAGFGRDTRSFSAGLWRFVNLASFNFYLHAEHHLRPSQAIPIPGAPKRRAA